MKVLNSFLNNNFQSTIESNRFRWNNKRWKENVPSVRDASKDALLVTREDADGLIMLNVDNKVASCEQPVVRLN